MKFKAPLILLALFFGYLAQGLIAGQPATTATPGCQGTVQATNDCGGPVWIEKTVRVPVTVFEERKVKVPYYPASVTTTTPDCGGTPHPSADTGRRCLFRGVLTRVADRSAARASRIRDRLVLPANGCQGASIPAALPAPPADPPVDPPVDPPATTP